MNHERLGKETDGPIAKYLNRKISTRITKFILSKGVFITPNQASGMSFGIGLTSSFLYFLVPAWMAGFFVQAASIVDGVDGELSRVLGKSSEKGGFLDAVSDRVVDILIVLSVSELLLNELGFSHFLFITAILALSGSLMVSYIHARGEASIHVHPAKIGRVPNFASRDVRLFLIFLGSIGSLLDMRSLMIAMIIIAVMSHLYVISKSVELYLAKELSG